MANVLKPVPTSGKSLITVALSLQMFLRSSTASDWPLMRAAAREFVETERSWAHSVARYRQVYASVLEGGGSS